MFSKSKKSQVELLREKLSDLQAARQEIIEQSTARRLEKLADDERALRDEIFEAERIESAAKKTTQPSQEESDLWVQIRELMDKQQDVLRQAGTVPSRYIRSDAVSHYTAEIDKQRVELAAKVSGLLPHQTMGPRLRERVNDFETIEQEFPKKVKPLCIAGEKIFSIRQQISELTAKRDALRQDRESLAVASL